MGNYINVPSPKDTDTLILKFFKYVKTQKLFVCAEDYFKTLYEEGVTDLSKE